MTPFRLLAAFDAMYPAPLTLVRAAATAIFPIALATPRARDFCCALLYCMVGGGGVDGPCQCVEVKLIDACSPRVSAGTVSNGCCVFNLQVRVGREGGVSMRQRWVGRLTCFLVDCTYRIMAVETR